MSETRPNDSDDGPAEIWLSPSCTASCNEGEGRQWCEDPFWDDPCPDCGKRPVRYVRADLVATPAPPPNG